MIDEISVLLINYNPLDSSDTYFKLLSLEFIKGGGHTVNPTYNKGHFTVSSCVIDTAHKNMLLIYSEKYYRWLQPGGHVEITKDKIPQDTALRETFEETNLQCHLISNSLFDIDVHKVSDKHLHTPHFHYDLRFLLEVDKKSEIIPNYESTQIKWFDIVSLSQSNDKSISIVRLANKVLDTIK